MIEEAIIHVGMHKTGSSSIQETLHHLEPRRRSSVGYLKLNSPNHSAFFGSSHESVHGETLE